MRRATLLLPLTLTAALVAGCGGSDDGPSAGASTPAPAADTSASTSASPSAQAAPALPPKLCEVKADITGGLTESWSAQGLSAPSPIAKKGVEAAQYVSTSGGVTLLVNSINGKRPAEFLVQKGQKAWIGITDGITAAEDGSGAEVKATGTARDRLNKSGGNVKATEAPIQLTVNFSQCTQN